jgi:uncharacterized protein YdbL (DUF1318 family)
MNRRSFLFVILSLVLTALLPGRIALGADKRLEDLHEKFRGRYPQIRELKQAGTVGETADGYLDFVKGKKGDAAKLVSEENADRKELYKIIAEKESTTPELVGQRAAKRNFEKAEKGEYLKSADGKWTQKS